MRFSVSDTAEYGDYTRGPRVIDARVRQTMKEIPRRNTVPASSPRVDRREQERTQEFLAMREAARNQRLEVVGRGLREMMTFLKKKKEAGVPEDDAAGAASK